MWEVAGTQLEITMANVKEMLMHDKTSLWIPCPLCDGKTKVKVYQETLLIKIPAFLPEVQTGRIVDVVQLKIVISK